MDGQNARAVVRVGADKRLLRAQMGDDIDGWKVAQIDGRKVVLASQDGRFATYRLFTDDRGAADTAGGVTADGPRNLPMPPLRCRQVGWSSSNRQNPGRVKTQFGFNRLASYYLIRPHAGCTNCTLQ